VPAISPDGKYIAGNAPDEEKKSLKLSVLSADDGKLVKQFDIFANGFGNSVKWGMNSECLYFLRPDGSKAIQIWRQALLGGKPQQLTSLSGQNVFRFAPSPDGKLWAYEAGRDIDDLYLLRSNISK
jgi:Tol biopolymer transport system component